MITAADFTLANGFKVISKKTDSEPVVCLQLHIKTGSVNETHESSGYSHFIEHLTFKNTTNYPCNEISCRVPFLGGIINAYTEYDTTCYYLMLPCEELRHGLAILADIVFKADFNDEYIEIEKGIIIEEIKQYANEPESSFIDWIQSKYFKSNPLRNPVLGTMESVKNTNHEDIRKFYHQYYRPDNAFLVVTGHFEKVQLRSCIEELFSGWLVPNKEPSIKKRVLLPENNGFRYFSKSFVNNGDFLAFVQPELQEKDKLSNSMLIITKAFASGKQSRLHKRLVEKDKTAISITLHSISGLNTGIAIIQVQPQNADVLPDIIYAFYDEWLKVKHDFFSSQEIDMIKKELNYAWLYDFEYIESIASGLANEEVLGSYQTLYDFPAKIANVDNTALSKCLADYWKTDFMAIFHQGRKVLSEQIVSNIIKLFTQDMSDCTQPHIEMEQSTDSAQAIQQVVTHFDKPAGESSFKSVKLVNGMQLLMRRVLHKPTIGMALTSALSQLSEPPEQLGINYLTSNLLLFGTESRSYDEIQKECLNHGFNLKINHTLETTTIKGKCFPFSFEPMLKLTSEIMQTPLFPDEHFKLIKSAVLDSIRREKQSPFYHAYTGWVKLLLGPDTNLNKPYGNITQVGHTRLSKIREWFTDYFALSNFNICLTGDIDFNQMEDLCNHYLKARPGSKTVPEHICIYDSSEHKLKVRKNDSDQSNVILGGLGCTSSDHASNTAFFVLSQISGGELSSRFFNILREKYGYAYQSGFDFTSVRDLGYWFAYAICDKSDYKEVYKLMLAIFSDLRTNGVSTDELISAKNYLKGTQRFDMESLSWQASSISMLYALGYDYDYFMNRENRLNAVNQDIIKAIAEKYLNPDNIYTYLER